MNIQEFLSRNKGMTRTKLAEILAISPKTITRHDGKEPVMMLLALDAVHADIKRANTIKIECTKHWSGGNTYWSAYVEFKGKTYLFPYAHGYDREYEYAILETLNKAGLIPSDRGSVLSRDYNITIKEDVTEVKRKSEMYGIEDCTRRRRAITL